MRRIASSIMPRIKQIIKSFTIRLTWGIQIGLENDYVAAWNRIKTHNTGL